MRRLSAVVALLALLVPSREVHAQGTGAPGAGAASGADAVRSMCINLSEQAQTLRDSGRLRAAVDAFTACAKTECPKTVRHDCEGWLDAASKSLPTVIVTAVDAKGADVSHARLRVDREILLDTLTRMAIRVDPGEHTFALEYGNGKTVEQRLVIREGEHSRLILFHLPEDAPPPPVVVAVPPPEAAPTPPAPPAPPPETHVNRANAIVGGSLAVFGVGAAAASIYFESQVLSTSNTLTAECPHLCRSNPVLLNQLSTVSTDRIGAGVTLGVSVVAVGAALYVFIARPVGREPPSPATAFSVLPSNHGGTATWTIGF